MQAGGGGDCLFNPRYSDCLKERLLQTLGGARQPQQAQFDGHGCQGPVPATPGEAIDISHLLAMRTGWGACAGPYPAFRVPPQQQQQHQLPQQSLRGGGGGEVAIITQENLLTAMRARRLGPLRRPPQRQQQPPAPPPAAVDSARSIAAAESERRPPPPDTCSSYRDLKDRSRYPLPPPPPGRRSLPQPLLHDAQPQPVTSAGEPPQALERQAPLMVPEQSLRAPITTATSSESPTFSKSVGVGVVVGGVGSGGGFQTMPDLEMPALSLSFSYDRFRERLARWELGAVAAAPLAQHQQQQQHLQRRPAGLQIRSVLVSDRSAGPSATAESSPAAAADVATLPGRQGRRVLSNHKR